MGRKRSSNVSRPVPRAYSFGEPTVRSPQRERLLQWTREAGRRHRDPTTGLCLIERDTAWYAASLLASHTSDERAEGNAILQGLRSKDGTHTPATYLIIFHALGDALEPATRIHLREQVESQLVSAAEVVFRDGNVNHPLGAYCALILGGELCKQRWAVQLGCHRLAEFQARIGDHRGRFRRQAEMSEYNSLTYTPLSLCFLAAVASYARVDVGCALARFLEERIWIDMAMHYHGPSQQFAGPHSRSYAEDSLGGFSAMHCTMMAAFGIELFVDPTLPDRYRHPSNFFQNALPAILPFHVPAEAREIALGKRFPCHLRATTYAEHYHENSRRLVGVNGEELLGWMSGKAGPPVPMNTKDPFAFDDEVYHGGWSELTTYLHKDFALGSALLPYVNAGHADSVMVRIPRVQPVRSLADFRSGFTRGAFNGLLPGVPGLSHSSGTLLDGNFFIEEGRSAVYQHHNRVIICYAPKRTGHRGLSEYRTDFIWGYQAPFDHLAVDGQEVRSFPRTIPPGSTITFRDGNAFGVLIPLIPRPAPEDEPIRMSLQGDLLLISCWNYRGQPMSCSRDELSSWQTGFYLELHEGDAFGRQDEVDARAASIVVHDRFETPTRRHVTVAGGGDTMEMIYDPFRECVLSRTFNGVEEGVAHLVIEGEMSPELMEPPQTFFGSELLP